MSFLRGFEKWLNESAYRAGVRADEDAFNAREKQALKNEQKISEGKLERYDLNIYVPAAEDFKRP